MLFRSNEFTSTPEPYQPLRVDDNVAAQQREKLAALRNRRNNNSVVENLEKVTAAAKSDENLMPLIRDALLADATIGEISDALRAAWGTYRAPESW